MPLSRKLFTLACAIGAGGLVGCHNTPSDTPTTMPAPAANMSTGGPTTMPIAPALPTVVPATPTPPAPAKVMTHELTKDQPFFVDMPTGPNPPSQGLLRAGSKVLLLIPGAEYSQIETDMGITYFTPTDGLKPLGK
jgi:hypothetical protein